MRNIGIFFFLFSVIFLLFIVPEIGKDVQTNALLGQDYNTDEAKYFPSLIGVIILVISILMIIQGWRKKDKNKHSPKKKLTKLKNVGNLLLISLGYVILLEPLGFFTITPICLIVSLYFFGHRNWFVLTLTPILTTLIIFLCFETLMGIQLPKGILEWMFY